MSYLALYRKYRPNTFDGLIGQEHIVKTLVNQIKSERLGHAYLFTGTRGTGKTSAAKIFAKAINCLNNVNGSPCGECECCRALSDPSNIDVVEIDAASNNGVNEIRELREKVQYPPVTCRYKVYIVDEVHMLTGAAFNALLKTLEEPPKHAVFILATTEVHKIPATILSRCMRFDFRLIATEKIAKHISDIYDEQGKEYEKEAIFAIAKAGDGSIRDALSIADTAISYSTGKLTYDEVMEILGSSNREILTEFVGGIINSETGKVLNTIDKLSSLGKSMGVLVKDVCAIVRDLLVVKTCSNASTILALPEAKFNEYKSIVDSTNENRLLRVLEIFSDAENALKYTNHPRVLFETAAIKAARPDSDYNIDALISRIKLLESKLNKIESEGVRVNVEKNDNTQVLSSENQIKTQIKEQTDISQTKEQDYVSVEVKKITLSSVTLSELKGKLLNNLRKNGSEMLWNMLQGVDLNVENNVLTFTVNNADDKDLLEKQASKTRIFEALAEFVQFNVEVKLSQAQKNLGEVDQATERIRKIFGDDIIVIK